MQTTHVKSRTKHLSPRALSLGMAAMTAIASPVLSQTPYPPMMRGGTQSLDLKRSWNVDAKFTVGEEINGYLPVGILDGTAAFPLNDTTVRILANHELTSDRGYAYSLLNGTTMTGARVSYFDVDRATRTIIDAGPAYHTAYDRQGNLVTEAGQINELGHATDGFDRFCSAMGVEPGQYGFVDNIFFINEETGTPGHPHGGSVWALDVDNGEIWGLPAFGRGGWENVAPFDSGSDNHVALLLGDDTAGAPLYLYIGEKNALNDGSFLDRNGLAVGQVYAWVADNGDASPEQFNGLGEVRPGGFVPIEVRDLSMAGMPGYDEFGYLDDVTLRASAFALGAHSFSRPEDLHANPANGSQLVFASTGRGQLFPSDNWGIIYQVDMNVTDLADPRGTLTIIHDADDLAVPDTGIRSPDNLTWAADGFIYIQEDKSTSPGSLFGSVTGVEASIWRLDPVSLRRLRVAVIDRSVVAPNGTTDSGAGEIGNWESSGVIDVTHLFNTAPGETLLFATVQAHGIRDGVIGGSSQLVEGGQLIFLSNLNSPALFPGR